MKSLLTCSSSACLLTRMHSVYLTKNSNTSRDLHHFCSSTCHPLLKCLGAARHAAVYLIYSSWTGLSSQTESQKSATSFGVWVRMGINTAALRIMWYWFNAKTYVCYADLNYEFDQNSQSRVYLSWLAVWLSSNALASINVVALRQTRLVPGRMTVCGRVNHLSM